MKATEVFFPNEIMCEMACEPYMTCNVDQRSFKAYLSRFMALTVKMAPFTADYIIPKLRSSAVAAARHCSFGEDQNTCGMRWTENAWEKWWGVGEQMSALETIQSCMVMGAKEYATEYHGGTSKGSPAAGATQPVKESTKNSKMRDKVGAWILTVAVSLSIVGFSLGIAVM